MAFPQARMYHSRPDYVKIGVALAATAYFLWVVATPDTWRLLDNVHLVMHEAGHFILLFFGQFLSVAGGTIMQLLMPMVFIVYFYLSRQYFSAAILLFWLGSSLLNVYVYAADAQAMRLPLLGGDSTNHDWNYMLSSLGALEHTAAIANSIRGLGVITMLAAAYFSFKNARKLEIK